MTERDLAGKVITAAVISGAAYLGTSGILEATSGRQQNLNTPNKQTLSKDLSCIIPQMEKSPMGQNQVVLIHLKEKTEADAIGLILSEPQKNPAGEFCVYPLAVQGLTDAKANYNSSLGGEKLIPASGIKVNLLFEDESIAFPAVLTGRGRQAEIKGKPEAQAEVVWKNQNGIEESGYVGLNAIKVIPEKPIGSGGSIEIAKIAVDGELVSFGDGQLGTIANIRYENDQRNALVVWYEQGVRIEKWMNAKDYFAVSKTPDQNSISLPQNFQLKGIWKNDYDKNAPFCNICLSKPLNEAYLRTISIIGESTQQVELVQGDYDFPMAANFYEIFFDKKKAAPELLWTKWGEGITAYDVLVEEIGHTRLIGWDYDTDQALARSLIILTRNVPEASFAGEPERWKMAKFFANIERKNPGFLKFWADKTNAWREVQYNGYRYRITPEIAEKWANEFKDKLWNELAYGLLQCKYWTQGEQDFKMPEKDCKDLEVCELHSWPTTDGTKGTPFWDKTTTVYDSQTSTCHINTEFFYGVSCGGCLDKDLVK
jgi:hypothetical protein